MTSSDADGFKIGGLGSRPCAELLHPCALTLNSRGGVVVHVRDATGKKPQPPRTRSITKALTLRYFLRVPSWPWWLTISKIAPLPAVGLRQDASRPSSSWCAVYSKSPGGMFRDHERA